MDLENLEKKVNQIIYTLDTICDANIITLAQAVFEIFCSTFTSGSNLQILDILSAFKQKEMLENS